MGETPAQIAQQGVIRLREADETDAFVGRADQQATERGIGERGANFLTRATAPGTARGHAEQFAGILIHAAFRAKAGAGYGVGHPVTVGQCGLQAAGAHTFGVAARRDPGMVAKHPQEVKA